MTSSERAKWCLHQADEVEASLPPRDDDELMPIGYVMADWFRSMAFRVAGSSGEGSA